ncbi:MAG TPA: YceI family protein [Hanamia sp.]|nr:YceI family protein [Hanamia sp.]
MMKNLLFCLFLISIKAASQNYTPVDSASKVHFVIKNFGISTGGDFSGLKGDIHFIPENLSACSFNVTVAVKSVDTDNEMRDKNLVSDEYFDAAKFPVIKIVSAKIDKTNQTGSGFYYFTGTLTIKGVSKNIAFPFQAKKVNDGYLFTGNFQIDRTDFGVGEKNMVLSSNVAVSLSVTAKKL